jgi:hypothetical protein
VILPESDPLSGSFFSAFKLPGLRTSKKIDIINIDFITFSDKKYGKCRIMENTAGRKINGNNQ